jgi:hypothetical protein
MCRANCVAARSGRSGVCVRRCGGDFVCMFAARTVLAVSVVVRQVAVGWGMREPRRNGVTRWTRRCAAMRCDAGRPPPPPLSQHLSHYFSPARIILRRRHADMPPRAPQRHELRQARYPVSERSPPRSQYPRRDAPTCRRSGVGLPWSRLGPSGPHRIHLGLRGPAPAPLRRLHRVDAELPP